MSVMLQMSLLPEGSCTNSPMKVWLPDTGHFLLSAVGPELSRQRLGPARVVTQFSMRLKCRWFAWGVTSVRLPAHHAVAPELARA